MLVAWRAKTWCRLVCSSVAELYARLPHCDRGRLAAVPVSRHAVSAGPAHLVRKPIETSRPVQPAVAACSCSKGLAAARHVRSAAREITSDRVVSRVVSDHTMRHESTTRSHPRHYTWSPSNYASRCTAYHACARVAGFWPRGTAGV